MKPVIYFRGGLWYCGVNYDDPHESCGFTPSAAYWKWIAASFDANCGKKK